MTMNPVILNKALVAIANRTIFADLTLLVDANFVPSVETVASTDLRTRLGLIFPEADDYHIKSLLGAVTASPLVAAAFEDPVTTYETGRFGPQDVQVITPTTSLTQFSLDPITGTTLPNCNVSIITSSGFAWLQFYDTVATAWTYVWFNNDVLQFGTSAPSGIIGCRVNGGFLQLLDAGTGGYRSIWWKGGVLQQGTVDNSSADGNPPTAALLSFSPKSTTIQLADQNFPGYFRSVVLQGEVLGAGPLSTVTPNASLVNDITGNPPSVSLVAPIVPVPDRVTINYLATGVVGITYGPMSGVFGATLVGGIIYPNWPSWAAITGGLSKGQWAVGDQVSIVARPLSFPWSLMQASLAGSTALNSFLQQQDLVNNFGQAEDAAEAVAVAALALGLSNPAVYPNG